jgi:branched-chain amino acid transport system ATP-binding protein
MSLILSVDHIHTYYGESYILQDLSLTLDEASVVGLVGRNGMGKTTTMYSVIGFTPPRHGKLTVKENLMISCRSKEKVGSWDMERVFSLFPPLRVRVKNRGDQLSGGEQQMLAIARALISNPDLMLMDEPSEGLAPLVIETIGSTIQHLKQGGFSILLAEQNLPLALGVADYVYVINKGKVVFGGLPQELQNNEQVSREYLAL